MKRNARNGFTLVEVLIVVVIMAILAATIVPQFNNSASDSKAGTNKFNLHTMRAQIELYRAQHNGTLPGATLIELTKNTDISGAQGTGANFPYGPYIREIPTNTVSNSKTVKVITNNPATASDVTGTGGWLYNATTGGIWIDDATQYTQ
ncbi:MAG: prepilin-type N-terminal cleavage/methylation domain-containing protein [Pirellulaceae bacterium]|nr:prepilin-type N-terminal cleavage/methylation domain-containing protein [Pirellulaceae bacterium]